MTKYGYLEGGWVGYRYSTLPGTPVPHHPGYTLPAPPVPARQHDGGTRGQIWPWGSNPSLNSLEGLYSQGS